jgi:hypothetical protein
MPPKLNSKRARFVLDKIDQILSWDRDSDHARDTKFVELGRYLCEVRAGQYWRVEKLKSFDDFLECRFPGSRRRAYYFMSIHEHMPKQLKSELNAIGWKKSAELVKVIRRDPEHFECAPWVHKAKTMPKEKFTDEVEKFLTGSAEASDLLYFKVYKSQLPVIEEALEIAARMLGSEKSCGYCLEMICADFSAGASLEVADSDGLLWSAKRLCKFLPDDDKRSLAAELIAA